MDRISWYSQATEGDEFGGLQIPFLVFTDEIVLLASLNSDFQFTVTQFAVDYE